MNTPTVTRRNVLQMGALGATGAFIALSGLACTKSEIPQEIAEKSATLDFETYLDIPTMFHNDADAVADKWNIKELVQMDRWYRDNCKWEKMELCYLEDSLVNVSWYSGGGREFVRASAEQAVSASPQTAPKHKIFNTHIWLNGTKAIAETQCMMLSPYGSQYKGMDYTNLNFARLFERVEKVDGIWGIRQFDTIYERGYILPLRPAPEFEVDPSELEGYRESYKCICWELNSMGIETNPDQPGEDRPDLVEALYQGASEWMKS